MEHRFTLSELANAALGGPAITIDHLSVLQTLFSILLKKLNCENETIQITGFEGPLCREIFNNSNLISLKFKTKNNENYQKYYDLLDKLETQTKCMQDTLEKHFAEIRKRCATNEFSAKFWDFYASPTEDLCTLYSDYNKEFCIMAQHPTFNVEIRRRMTLPVVRRISEFDAKVEAMQDTLRKTNQIADEVMAKLNLVESLIGDVESKRQEIQKQWQTTREALQETQEMLNCKLERIALPTMKKDLEKRFSTVDKHIALLRRLPYNCTPNTVLDVKKEGTCISCSPCKSGKPKPKLNIKFYHEKECRCRTTLHKEPTLLDKMDRIKVKTYKLIAVPLTSPDKATSTTIAQQFLDAGHFVHSYASYNKHRLHDSMDLDPLITVVENISLKSKRRLKSFDPVKSLIAISSHRRTSTTSTDLPIGRAKSRLTTNKHPTSGDGVRKSLRQFHKTANDRGKSIALSSVNFSSVE
ncbi:uncharacterized protein [Musca autumnalis]|uniref:uncharacterized protein n=1 Tax=Musca autumnalis TaxID=221902 RepID=UPI003CF4C3E1